MAVASPLIVLLGMTLLGPPRLLEAVSDAGTRFDRLILFLITTAAVGLAVGGVGLAAVGWFLTSSETAQSALGEAEERFDAFRRAERLQAQRLRLYSMIFQGAQDAVLLADADGRIRLWNPAAERIFGYTRNEALRLRVESLFSTRMEARHVMQLTQAAFREREGAARAGPVEVRGVRKDGSEVRVGLTVSPVRDPESGGRLALAISRDITARKRMEERLRESEDQFRRIFENAAVGMAILAPDGGFIKVNDTYCKIVGYSREELGERTSESITHPDDREHDEKLVRRLFKGEIDQYALEKRYVRKDGRIVWTHVSASALRDATGRTLRLIGLVEDVTNRKHAEALLLESERRLRHLVTAVKEHAIFLLDSEGRVTLWNEGAERINGYAPEAVLGRHLSGLYTPEDVDAGKPEALLQRARREGRVEDEGWRVRKDGSRFWANEVITALQDEDGDIEGFAGVTRDLTRGPLCRDAPGARHAG